MKEDLRNKFIIIKGTFSKKKPLINVGEESFYIGGYDPEEESTKEWYRVIEKTTGNVIHASNSLDKALNSIRREIIRSKDFNGYLKSVNKFSLGEGKLMSLMNQALIEEYGYYFEEEIEKMEEEAYNFLKDNTNVKKAKRRFKKIGMGKPY